jgi:hypothetical protein
MADDGRQDRAGDLPHRTPSGRASTILVGLSLACSVAALAVSVLVYLEVRTPRTGGSVAAETAGAQTPHGGAGPDADDSSPDLLAPGHSVGRPRGGALFAGTRLPPGPGYHIRHPDRVWGTHGTVRHLVRVIDGVREQFPALHRVSVGDLSSEVGGLLPGHVSHQSGRDVDLGFYYRKKPRDYPHRFVPATKTNLHFRATWALLESLANTIGEPEGVAWILLDYRVQKLLHTFARNHGASEATLQKVFQYPHGPATETGIVRHFPGHEDHFHIRFKCSTADTHCRAGVGPWRRLGAELPAELDASTSDDRDAATSESPPA